jgi:4-hydroxybenzoate polyprenyltransferase
MSVPVVASDPPQEVRGLGRKVGIYLEMIKFGHTVFALPFALAALAIAIKRIGAVRPLDVLGVLLCMVFARTTAMGFNRWADRDIDAANPRTAGRAIPAGLLSPGQVLRFTLAAAAAFVASTSLFWFSSGNFWPAIFAAPLLAFLCGYSYAKRFTRGSHFWLGLALAGSPLGVWIALLPPGSWAPPFALGAAIASWVAGFDILYAGQDLEFDRIAGLRSLPERLGMEGAFRVARGLHALTLAALVWFGLATPELGTWHWLGVAAAAALLTTQHWLVRRRDLTRINIAFLWVNGAISLGLLTTTLLDLLAPIGR